MGIMSDLGSGLTGNVESAYLVIKDYRKVSKAAGGGLASMLNNTASALGNSGLSSLVSNAASEDKTFKVQFNPHDLQIDAHTEKVDKADAQKKNGRQKNISGAVVKPTVELTVNLIFDKVNIYDSFMWDKFTAGASATGVTNVASAIATAMGKTWTVQTEVEGLLAALQNQYTRNITFQWANFSFSGLLKNVVARYTMFSTSGRPVRAQVMLRLRQELDPEKLQNWYNDFDDAFDSDSSNLVSAGQNVSSLMNLGI